MTPNPDTAWIKDAVAEYSRGTRTGMLTDMLVGAIAGGLVTLALVAPWLRG